jgi:hypothetical protein
MSEPTHLDAGQRHLLSLIAKDAKTDGWAITSEVVYRYIATNMPKDLVECREEEDRTLVRLTDKGRSIVDAMSYLC